MKDSNKENKPKVPKLKFSSYWIYGGVFLLLIAFQFFNSGSLDSKTLSKNKFERVLNDNDIKKILVINNTTAQIFLTQKALEKEKYKEQKSSAFYRPESPIFEYNFGDQQNFENEVEVAKKLKNLIVDVENKSQTSLFDTLIGFLQFIILIGVLLLNLIIFGFANRNIASTANRNTNNAFLLGLLGPLGMIICLFQSVKPTQKKILYGIGRFIIFAIGMQILAETGTITGAAKGVLLFFFGFSFILRGVNMFNYSLKKVDI